MKARSAAGLVIPAFGRLFEVDILKLSRVSVRLGLGDEVAEGIRPETGARNGFDGLNRVFT